MRLFKLQVASPDGLKFEGEVRQLSVRGICGELAIMAGHIPFVTALAPGECRIYTEKDGEILRANASGGMLVVADDGVRLMSSDFVWSDNNRA